MTLQGQVVKSFSSSKREGGDFVAACVSPKEEWIYYVGEDRNSYCFSYNSGNLEHLMKAKELPILELRGSDSNAMLVECLQDNTTNLGFHMESSNNLMEKAILFIHIVWKSRGILLQPGREMVKDKVKAQIGARIRNESCSLWFDCWDDAGLPLRCIIQVDSISSLLGIVEVSPLGGEGPPLSQGLDDTSSFLDVSLGVTNDYSTSLGVDGTSHHVVGSTPTSQTVIGASTPQVVSGASNACGVSAKTTNINGLSRTSQ
ncbi:hypothetical protein ACH5RR_012554 [Cinchona calisaya]|uniref:Uncharacterized protein n=1 Tax=Cinchona calisaya TaxID=153742 RepID=A0ABD3ADW7_9GENT